MPSHALAVGGGELSSFLQNKTNAMVLRYAPPTWGRAYLGLVSRVFFALTPDQRQAFVDSIGLCFDKKTVRKIWPTIRAGVVDHYFEKLLIAARPLEWFKDFHLNHVELQGSEVLDQALEKGNGVLLVTGHYGAVELMPSALALNGYPVTVMVHCKSAGLRRRISNLAERIGINLLDPKSGSVVFGALGELQKNRVLMTQCDELDMWRPHPKRKVSFLGHRLNQDKSLDVLARKSKAEVVMALNHRLGDFRYRLSMENPMEHPAARGMSSISAACLAVLTEHIMECPEAWYEWKKLIKYIPIPAPRDKHATSASTSLLGQMALQDACGAPSCTQ